MDCPVSHCPCCQRSIGLLPFCLLGTFMVSPIKFSPWPLAGSCLLAWPWLPFLRYSVVGAIGLRRATALMLNYSSLSLWILGRFLISYQSWKGNRRRDAVCRHNYFHPIRIISYPIQYTSIHCPTFLLQPLWWIGNCPRRTALLFHSFFLLFFLSFFFSFSFVRGIVPTA